MAVFSFYGVVTQCIKFFVARQLSAHDASLASHSCTVISLSSPLTIFCLAFFLPYAKGLTLSTFIYRHHFLQEPFAAMDPKPNIFLTARWQNLAMINFEVDPAILLPYIPPYTELDLYNNKALVSVVGFMFNDTKVFGLRWPFHTSFPEVNLRLYVKHFDGKSYRRGVVFISEIVPRPIIAYMANLLYHERYRAMPMRNSLTLDGETLSASYSWKPKRKWNSIEVKAEASLSNIIPGSEEEFIFEHYWGYTAYNGSTTIEYGVEHDIWQVHKVNEWALDCDVATLYGDHFVPFLSKEPSSVFLAKGSTIIIRKPRFIRELAKTS
jgi:uncharacterized protein YqjF (DUF2071 family)